MDYAATNRLYEKLVDDGYIADGISGEHRTKVLESVLKMVLHQQLTWTLCQDHPESISSLTIPLKDIQRYVDHVYQFTSLSDVSFSVDGIGWYWSCIPSYAWDQPEIEPTERDRMMEFVRRHTSTHKNVLRNIGIPHPTELGGTDRHSHVHVRFAIQSLLPPFQNSQSIDTDWVALLARHSNANLSHLESINVTYNIEDQQSEEISKLLRSHPPLLSYCRVLKRLVAESVGSGMFQWADIWDLNLPKLRKLNLAAVFAFTFDFQWLQQLPNLQTLQLSTVSSDEQCISGP
ncbi:MAG: hypothetical protein J3Q66DRAFT_426719 [Benniella sp.]|nr:MAG: hypothetical protein J3Q66DRAFT_426719 [Benniella sp.]